DFLREKLIDIHTHVWLSEFLPPRKPPIRWPGLIAEENPIEDHFRTYELMFPDKKVTPMIFPICNRNINFELANGYVSDKAKEFNLPSLILTNPKWSAEEFENKMLGGNFLGAKVYLSFAEPYIPSNEIRIFDFAPHHLLEVLNKHGKILMLHIPRSGRLKDPVNLAQMVEIEERYPNIKLIIAHVGRAYCNEDVGNAFDVIREKTKNMLFDFSANTNSDVFEQLIKTVGPKRIMFGSDMPILRMRNKRITENGIYINCIPKGIFGDVSYDKNMREIDGPEADKITFFMYEEIAAFKKAAENCNLTKSDIEDIFYNNAKNLIESVRGK
ncbi:MAG: amidohydrolase, partial [Clostridia bacterium]|nr:amidohydrolase [Clostridia bacterium]